MEMNSFSFMKEGFDWEQEQANDLKELEKTLNNYQDNTHGVVGQWQDYYEEGTDNLMDKYRDVGMSPGDFYSGAD